MAGPLIESAGVLHHTDTYVQCSTYILTLQHKLNYYKKIVNYYLF